MKVITNWFDLVWTFFFFTGSWIHSPRRPTFVLKNAAGSATLKSFHFSPASLGWLHAWLLMYLDIVQAKQAQQTSESPEESEWMQPNSDTCHFVFCISTPSPRMSPFNEGRNTVLHTNFQLLPWWDCWPCSLSAWIWEPGRSFFCVRWVTVRIWKCYLNLKKMQLIIVMGLVFVSNYKIKWCLLVIFLRGIWCVMWNIWIVTVSMSVTRFTNTPYINSSFFLQTSS